MPKYVTRVDHFLSRFEDCLFCFAKIKHGMTILCYKLTNL